MSYRIVGCVISVAIVALALTSRSCGRLPRPGDPIPVPANDDLARLTQSVNTLGFRVRKTIPKRDYVYDLVIRDLDGDRRGEIVCRFSSASDDLRAMDAEGKVKWSATVGTAGNGNARILCEDLDGDGAIEVLTNGQVPGSKPSLKILDGSGHRRSEIPFDEDQVYSIFSLDRGVDNRPRVVVEAGSNFTRPEVWVLESGDGKDRAPAVRKLGDADPLVARVQADPRSLGARRRKNGEIGSEGIRIGSRTWHFNGTLEAEVDLNGDGVRHTVCTAQRRATCVVPTQILVFSPEGEPVYSHQTQSWVGGLDVGDVDGDGRKEIVYAGHFTDSIYVLGR